MKPDSYRACSMFKSNVLATVKSSVCLVIHPLNINFVVVVVVGASALTPHSFPALRRESYIHDVLVTCIGSVTRCCLLLYESQ